MSGKKTGATGVPEPVAGLGPEVELPKMVPALQPADVALGVVARYQGHDTRKSKGFDRPQLLHMFQLSQEYGATRFALWGAVQLDLKLRGMRSGTIVVVQYQGKAAGQGDRFSHVFSVRPFAGTTQDLQAVQEQYRPGCLAALAAVQAIESRSTGGDFYQHTDDDIPF